MKLTEQDKRRLRTAIGVLVGEFVDDSVNEMMGYAGTVYPVPYETTVELCAGVIFDTIIKASEPEQKEQPE